MNLRKGVLVAGCSLLVPAFSVGQEAIPFAELDPRTTLTVGETVTIRSRFEDHPVVEPHLSAHPTDNDHLLAAAMVITDIARPYESARLSSFVSTDGGKRWKETTHDWWGYDPWTAILPDGNTAMTWLGTPERFEGRFPIRFFSSKNGGIRWNPEVETASGNHDGTKLASRGDSIYFTSVRFNPRMGADVVLYRRKGSRTFEQVMKIDGKGQRLSFCEPAILSDGTVVIPAGRHMQSAWVHRFDPESGSLSEPYTITDAAGGAGGYMRLVVDAGTQSRFRDRLYFVRSVGRGRDYRGIWLNASSDGGRTWTGDRRIDRFATTPGSKAIVATPAVNRSGVLVISWVDRQNDPEQRNKDVYVAASIDGGRSFQRPVRVTTVGSDPKTRRNGDVANKFPGGGHYLAIAARADGSFQLIWSDSRSGMFELQTANVSVRLPTANGD